MNNISVIGMGKLGSPLAAVLASSGFNVIGLDKNPAVVDMVVRGRAPVSEPGLQDLMDLSTGRLSATMHYQEAIANSNISFVIVPTPSDTTGQFTNKFIIDAVENIGKEIAKKDQFHLVNICSTVMPGSCDGEISEALERASGKRIGEGVGLSYNPEFIALGSVIKNMHFPDMILIGCNNYVTGEMLAEIYKQCCKNNPPIKIMNLVNAELTKITVNTFVTTKISFVNMVSELCDELPGADIDQVASAVGLDSRIGNKYFKGGLGYGGPCFPRDNIAFTSLAKSLNIDAAIASATDRINWRQIDRLLNKIKHLRPKRKSVGILGLTYKPDTPVTECSQAIELANRLIKEGYQVTVYDPQGIDSARYKLDPQISFALASHQVLSESDLIIIMTPWPEFKNIDFSILASAQKKIVIDCWRILKMEKNINEVQIEYLGFKSEK
jgi:UDPglucose 6-dehydrogenase